MLRWAVKEHDGPVAVRYPRGGEGSYIDSDWNGTDCMIHSHRSGRDVTMVTYGTMLENVLFAAEILAQQGIEANVVRLLSVADAALEQLRDEINENSTVVVVEEICHGSGIGPAVAHILSQKHASIRTAVRDLGNEFVTHGNQKKLYESTGLDASSIAAFTKEVLSQ